MKKRLLGSSELWTVIKIILILTIIFGFNDGSENFIFSKWFANFLFTCLIVSLIVSFNILGLKLAAKYYGTELKVKIWNSHKFKTATSFGKKFLLLYTTPILSIIVMLLSNGRIYLSTVMSFSVNEKLFGRKFQNLTYFNISSIVFFGLLSNLILMWIFKLLEFDLGLKLSFWFILFSLLPISELPGTKLLLGSTTFYIFNLVFFILNAILLYVSSSFANLLISMIFSVVFAGLFFFFFQYKKA